MSVSLTSIIPGIGLCSLSLLWVLVSTSSCRDCTVDKEEYIVFFFQHPHHKKNSQSCSDDKIFHLWEALCMGCAFVVMFHQDLSFGLTSLLACCFCTKLRIWSSTALNWVEICRNLLKDSNLFLPFSFSFTFSPSQWRENRFLREKFKHVDFSLRRGIVIAFSCVWSACS